MGDSAPRLSPSADHHHVAPGEAWRGLRGGLTPLAVLVLSVAATVGLTVVARHLLAGSGFFAAQGACVTVLAGGRRVSTPFFESTRASLGFSGGLPGSPGGAPPWGGASHSGRG